MTCPLRSTTITAASSLLRGSPPLSGASVLSASRLEPLAPFPLSSPARFSRSVPEPDRASRCLHAGCRSVGIAHSRDGDQVFQAMVVTDSSDRDQVRRRTRLTGLCVLEMASSSRLAGRFGDRAGGPWEGPVRGAECPHERRSDARGRDLWAGGTIAREVLTVFSFRRLDGAGCRL
jgi:hypothetical protein